MPSGDSPGLSGLTIYVRWRWHSAQLPLCWSYLKPSPSWANEAGSGRTPKELDSAQEQASERAAIVMFVHFMCAMQNAQIVQCCAFACKIPFPLPSRPLPTAWAILLQDAFGSVSDVPFRKCDSFRSGHCCARASIEWTCEVALPHADCAINGAYKEREREREREREWESERKSEREWVNPVQLWTSIGLRKPRNCNEYREPSRVEAAQDTIVTNLRLLLPQWTHTHTDSRCQTSRPCIMLMHTTFDWTLFSADDPVNGDGVTDFTKTQAGSVASATGLCHLQMMERFPCNLPLPLPPINCHSAGHRKRWPRTNDGCRLHRFIQDNLIVITFHKHVIVMGL